MKEGLEKEVKIFFKKRSLKEANKDFVEGRPGGRGKLVRRS